MSWETGEFVMVSAAVVAVTTGTAALEVSLMVIEADLPCAVTVRVSAPSVAKSAIVGIAIVAVPLELTIATPERAPPVISAELTPPMV
jgi:hypothetical protein